MLYSRVCWGSSAGWSYGGNGQLSTGSTYNLTIGDLDGDGYPDLGFGRGNATPSFRLYYSNPRDNNRCEMLTTSDSLLAPLFVGNTDW